MKESEKKCKNCFWSFVVQQIEVEGSDLKKGKIQQVRIIKSKEKHIQRICEGLKPWHAKIADLNASCVNESQYKEIGS